jgi:hypothetical protein
MVVWCCVVLGRRLYAFVFVWLGRRFGFFVPLYVVLVLLVCPRRVVGVSVVYEGGLLGCMLVGCVFCRFVWFCSRLWCVSSVPPTLHFYYRVSSLHCAGGLIGTWSVCLSTLSFLM